ncbi:G-type lectin S-receptor-like serine/threonine-protein kinase [Actinidia chinensis var. chinensis]|uniref:Receptor-like serine/threonine-protein kinase n=1 Tax=Actinidia chinensis var. chinensis TaxID=1590841 RepID=A0A2R6QC53_ACTCC|nr:G-type lectin S-receptor-like serine/threonine-protein kinase [Actinidia chinensis var. chinensis]
MSLKCKSQRLFLFVVLLFIISFNTHLSKASNTIYSGQSLSGNQTITSQDGVFELGFFTPGKSQNYYIGIWYKNLPNKTVVWVASRNQPISDPSSSELKLMRYGNLVLLEQSKTRIWSTNSSSNLANSTVATLLDNGNFVLRDTNSSNIIWQSFDYPTDTWLPGGKVGYNKLRNEKQVLSSWRSSEDPAPSLFSVEVEPNSSHVLLWNGSKLYWTSGLWDGKVFANVPEIAIDYYVKNFTYISNENESYFTYEAGFPTALTRFMLDVTGQLKQFVWRKEFPTWSLFWTKPPRQCDVYAFCGAFSSCNQNVPVCECIEGFKPRTLADWELGDHSDGCLRKTPLECENRGNDAFVLVTNISFPVNSEALTVGNIDKCQLVCLRNCSCTAYAYDNECLIWGSALFSLQKLPADDKSGRNLHVRVAASELVGTEAKPKTKKKTVWIVFGAIGGFFTLFSSILVIVWRRRHKARDDTLERVEDSLVVFKFRDIRNATKNFSEKLGEGGFGSVFRGTLPNSTLVAVKSLKSLKQGEKQFRAEVSTIGMIQHINLIHLCGFCIEGKQRFLVYDYMSNGSLESHLFNKDSNVLDWKTRYNIAIGTARGLAYLHEKCRDCIIHCDVKPENILLDGEYNPKVADFGLAKLLGRDFSRVLTTIRGTRGYLAPEWISGEAITPKADVFSYGMVLFEIISGTRNRDSVEDEMAKYFPYRVAAKINEGEEALTTLLDTKLEGNADVEELARACKVACWCIQDEDKNRPSMGQVVQVLEGVIEVDVHPIPRFIQGLTDNPMVPFVYQEISSSSSTVS